MAREDREAAWLAAMDDVKRVVDDVVRTYPHDDLVPFLDDLVRWAENYRDEQITRATRTMSALGYSRADISRVLGVTRFTLQQALANAGLGVHNPGRKRLSHDVPEDAIDISDQFDSMPRR